jgi:hypothetical protein
MIRFVYLGIWGTESLGNLTLVYLRLIQTMDLKKVEVLHYP